MKTKVLLICASVWVASGCSTGKKAGDEVVPLERIATGIPIAEPGVSPREFLAMKVAWDGPCNKPVEPKPTQIKAKSKTSAKSKSRAKKKRPASGDQAGSVQAARRSEEKLAQTPAKPASPGQIIQGFNLSVIDEDRKVLKKTFIQVKNGDKWGCSDYVAPVGDVVPEDVAQRLRKNEHFNGYIAISSVGTNQLESGVAMMKFPELSGSTGVTTQ